MKEEGRGQKEEEETQKEWEEVEAGQIKVKR